MHNIRNEAVVNGYLDVVCWLHNNRKEGCTKNALKWAAQCGNIEFVKWLCENRSEGNIEKAINTAKEYGYVNIAEWLDDYLLTLGKWFKENLKKNSQ